MTKSQKIGGIFWYIFSILFSLFVSAGLAFYFLIRSIDLHKNTSGPGDFAFTPASVILNDILSFWGVAAIVIFVIACIGFFVTSSIAKELADIIDSNGKKGLYILIFCSCA